MKMYLIFIISKLLSIIVLLYTGRHNIEYKKIKLKIAFYVFLLFDVPTSHILLSKDT